jgi:hypothetical protein
MTWEGVQPVLVKGTVTRRAALKPVGQAPPPSVRGRPLNLKTKSTLIGSVSFRATLVSSSLRYILTSPKGGVEMRCPYCQATATTERPNQTELGYRRFRCRECQHGLNERTGTPFNRLQYPTDVVCLMVLWRFRYKLSLRDLVEMFLQRGLVFTHEAVRDWEAKLTPLLSATLCKRRHSAVGNRGSRAIGALSTAPSTAMAI